MKRKAIIISIIVIALIIVAVASWLIYKKYFKKDGTEDSDSDDAPTTTPPTTTTSYPIPPEVKDVKSFQVYANAKGYKPKLVEDNKWGPASAAAWSVWGNDYQKEVIPSLKKGDRIMPRFPMANFPMANAVAYSTTTGKAIGRINSAIYERELRNNPNWILATAMIPTGALDIPTSTMVHLQTKDWIKA